MAAWRGWYHVVGNTYGTWLRGDPRGWRSRHHREHVDGDYHQPPPPKAHAVELTQSRGEMSRPPVCLDESARVAACGSMVEKLQAQGIDVVDLAIAATHYHLLARLGDQPKPARHIVGLAKKHSAHVLAETGLTPRGGVWGKRCLVKPITDRRHQVNVARYIARHAEQNAAVWSRLRRS